MPSRLPLRTALGVAIAATAGITSGQPVLGLVAITAVLIAVWPCRDSVSGAVLDDIQEGIAITRDGRVVTANRAARQILDSPLIGEDLNELGWAITPSDHDGQMRVNADSSRWVLISTTPTGRSDRTAVLTIRDVTAAATAQATVAAEAAVLRHKATHDALTGLPNTQHLHETIDALQQSRPRMTTGVVVLDLNGFKAVNDTHGHAVGDELLVQIAVRLRAVSRHGDLVCRTGGDEFVILSRNLPTTGGGTITERLAHRATSALSGTYPTSAGPVSVGATAGWAVADTSFEISAAMDDADRSMLAAKPSSRLAVTNPNDDDQSPLADGPTISVYIIDDDPAMRLLAERILVADGFAVTGAGVGYDAVAQVIDRRPDVVLCDMMMPGLNGGQIIDRIRDVLPAQTVLMWTAAADALRLHPTAGLAPSADKDDLSGLADIIRQLVAPPTPIGPSPSELAA